MNREHAAELVDQCIKGIPGMRKPGATTKRLYEALLAYTYESTMPIVKKLITEYEDKPAYACDADKVLSQIKLRAAATVIEERPMPLILGNKFKDGDVVAEYDEYGPIPATLGVIHLRAAKGEVDPWGFYAGPWGECGPEHPIYAWRGKYLWLWARVMDERQFGELRVVTAEEARQAKAHWAQMKAGGELMMDASAVMRAKGIAAGVGAG